MMSSSEEEAPTRAQVDRAKPKMLDTDTYMVGVCVCDLSQKGFSEKGVK